MDSDMDVPTETGSMSMDIDNGATSSRHSHSFDYQADCPGLGSCPGFCPTDPRLVGFIQTTFPPPDCEHLPAPGDSSQSMIASPSFSIIRPEQTGSVGGHGLPKQHRDIFSTPIPSSQDVTPLKRKRTDDIDISHTDDNDIPYGDAVVEASYPRPRGRRPRLRTRQDGEFTPLLIMSPATGSSAEEETISMFHQVTDAAHPIQRYFTDHPRSEAHGPRVIPAGHALPTVGEPTRTDSTSSFAAVALANLATTTTTATTHPRSRLSTLYDLPLPRPFDDDSPTDHLARTSIGTSRASIPVHARGLDVPPPFPSLSGARASRADQLLDPRAPHDGAWVGLMLDPPLGVKFFLDRPLCDSPDEIDSAEEPAQAIRGERVSA